MKILFVRPRPSPETIGLQHLMVVEPLELEVLAALVGPGDTPVILDMILEREPFDRLLARERPDLLCVTGYITHVDIMRSYCRLAKRLNPLTRTAVGGVHCEVCPDDLNDAAVDFRVVRNATTAFPALLEHLHGRGPVPPGVLRPGERADAAALPPFDFRYPLPARSLTARYRSSYFYIFHERIALLKTAFGCPYRCSFCFCRSITAGRYAERPLEDVMRELEQIDEREVYIVDDDFLVDRERVLAFVRENRRRGLRKRYVIYGRADFIARHPAVMAEFRDAGLSTVIVGFESFTDRELERYDKGTTAAMNREAMGVLNRNGIECYATVVVPPEWGREDFAACGAAMKDLGIHYVNLQPLTPLPGTGWAPRNGELLADPADRPRWDLAHVLIRPERLTVAEFYREILALYNDILFRPRVLWNYLRRYRPAQLWTMAAGTARVTLQYRRKVREAERAEVSGA